MSNWLLVETFGGAPHTVIGLGSSPRKMVPLQKILGRGHSLADIETAIDKATVAGTRIEHSSTNRHVIAEPLITFTARRPHHTTRQALGTSTSPPMSSAAATTFSTSTGWRPSCAATSAI